MMGDEEEWWETKRSDERRKEVMGDKKKWWEINRRGKEVMEIEKDVMGDEKDGIMRSNSRWKMMRDKK
jgi:hypothetical protein